MRSSFLQGNFGAAGAFLGGVLFVRDFPSEFIPASPGVLEIAVARLGGGKGNGLIRLRLCGG